MSDGRVPSARADLANMSNRSEMKIEEAAKRIFETEIAFGDQFQYKRDRPYELRWEKAKEQNLFCYRLAMAQAKAALEDAPPQQELARIQGRPIA